MSRRRLLIAAGRGNIIPATTPFVGIDAAGTLLCNIDGREYRKAYDGEAWVALIFTADGYTCPALLARTPEACVRDPLISDPPTQITFNGAVWYYSGSEWAQPGRWGSNMWDRIYSNPLMLPYIAPAGGTYFDTFAPATAATQLVRILLGVDVAEVARP